MNSLVINEDIFIPKAFPTNTALIRLFYRVSSPRLNKVKELSTGFPTFATLIKPFSRADTMTLNRFVVVAGSFLTFTPLVMTFSTEKGLLTIMRFLTVRSSLVLEKA